MLPGDVIDCERCGGQHLLELSQIGQCGVLAYSCGSHRVIGSRTLNLYIVCVEKQGIKK